MRGYRIRNVSATYDIFLRCPREYKAVRVEHWEDVEVQPAEVVRNPFVCSISRKQRVNEVNCEVESGPFSKKTLFHSLQEPCLAVHGCHRRSKLRASRCRNEESRSVNNMISTLTRKTNATFSPSKLRPSREVPIVFSWAIAGYRLAASRMYLSKSGKSWYLNIFSSFV